MQKSTETQLYSNTFMQSFLKFEGLDLSKVAAAAPVDCYRKVREQGIALAWIVGTDGCSF